MSEKRVGPIHGQNNGETALINIEHPLMKEDQKAWAEDERSRHIFAINKTWATAGFYSQPRFNERKNNQHIWWDIALHPRIISRRGKLVKENPKDDLKNWVINVFAPVRKSALLNLEQENSKLFSEAQGISVCKSKRLHERYVVSRRSLLYMEVFHDMYLLHVHVWYVDT